ncbi:hypothetical protein ACOSZF_20340 [Cytobacillus firmus]|uniref:hypothetical protein n=1 Tax=Cytobacillus firmus TaxID=1399 RepID=UPI003BA32419
MKFSFLETAKERSQSYKTFCLENDQKRAVARKEVEEAKAEEKALMDRQINGEDVFEELTKAQTKIRVAEAKYQRVVNEIGEKNPEMNLQGITFNSVQSQFGGYLNGGLQVDMEEELSELTEARDRYLVAVEKALSKFYRLRGEVKQEVMEAESLFGRPITGKLPIGFDEFLLRPYGLWWDRYDANNVLAPVYKRALENVEGPIPVYEGVKTQDVRVLPAEPDEWVDPNNPGYTRKRVK